MLAMVHRMEDELFINAILRAAARVSTLFTWGLARPSSTELIDAAHRR